MGDRMMRETENPTEDVLALRSILDHGMRTREGKSREGFPENRQTPRKSSGRE